MFHSHFNKAKRLFVHSLCFLFVIPPVFAADDGLVHIEADSLEGDENTVRASGNVRANFDDYSTCADTLTYNRSTGDIYALGSFQFKQDGNVIRGDSATFNTKARNGEIEQFNVELKDHPLQMRGDSMAVNEDILSAQAAFVTSCKPDNEIWSLFAAQTETNTTEKIIEAHDIRFEFLGVPVFYFPYVEWYYGEEKRSGILNPNGYFGSGDGVGFKIPYYVYLADNYDWTISGDWRSKHGLEVKNEFRFLTKHTTGEIGINSVFFDDTGRGQQYLDYLYENGPWAVRLFANNTDDDDYLREFGDGPDDKATRNLPRLAAVQYTHDGWVGRAEVEFFKTLYENEIAVPHRLYPALYLHHAGYSENHTWGNTWRYDNFLHNNPLRTQGGRFVWNSNFSRYFQFADTAVTPNIGAHAVKYRTHNGANSAFFVPHAQLNLQKRIPGGVSQFGEFLKADYRLRTAYIYAPETNQANAPLYDTELKQLSLENIYEWNRYVGNDRAADENLIAYGMEYRLYDAIAEQEAFFAGIAQRYYLDKSGVLIPGETVIQKGAGNVFMAARLLSDNWHANLSAEWDVRRNTMERIYADVLVEFSTRQLVRVGFLLDDEETVSVGGATPLGNYVDAAVSFDYVLDDDRYTSSLFALRIRNECDCWRMNIKIEDSVVGQDDNDISFSIGMEFVGLGSVGSDYESILDSIR